MGACFWRLEPLEIFTRSGRSWSHGKYPAPNSWVFCVLEKTVGAGLGRGSAPCLVTVTILLLGFHVIFVVYLYGKPVGMIGKSTCMGGGKARANPISIQSETDCSFLCRIPMNLYWSVDMFFSGKTGKRKGWRCAENIFTLETDMTVHGFREVF